MSLRIGLVQEGVSKAMVELIVVFCLLATFDVYAAWWSYGRIEDRIYQ
jgi:hypothetical protein